MSLELLTTPNKTINGLDSRAAGALLQLPYNFQRQDAQINRVYTSGGFAVFKLTGEADLEKWPIGARVFISPWAIVGGVLQPGGFTNIINADLSGGEVRIFTDSIPYASSEQPTDIGYANNPANKIGYKVEIRLFDESGNSLLDNVFRYATDPAGWLFVNLGTILSDYLFRKQLLSQLYKISYAEDWQGKEPEFITYPFTRVTDSGGGDITINFDDIGQDLSEQFPLGFQTFLKFDGAAYTDGLYSITFRNYIAPRFFFVISTPFLGDDTGTAASNEPVPVPESPVTQATFAAVGNYTEKGSNLVDYLLRAGGSPIEKIDYSRNGSTLNPREYDAGGFNWLEVSASRLLTPKIEGATLGIFNPIVFNPDKPAGTTSPDTLAACTGRYYVTISNFVADGAYRVDMVGIRRDNRGLTIWNNGNVVVNGNFQGFVNINLPTRAPDSPPVAEEFINVGLRFQKASGEYDLQIDILPAAGGNEPPFLLWETYPVAKLLTQFKNPMFWPGWYRSYAVLVDPKMIDRGIAINLRGIQQNYDINKAFISSIYTGTIGTNNGTPGVYIYEVREPTSDLAAYINIRIDDFNNIAISGPMQYKILPECENPIMVEYYNQLGVPEQHLFNITQEIELQATAGTGVTTPVNQDLAGDYSRRIGRRLPDFTQQILCTSENLLPDQYLALQELIYSSEVFIYLDKEGTKKLPVILSGEPSTSKETKDKRLSLQVTLELPLNVRFEDIKLY